MDLEQSMISTSVKQAPAQLTEVILCLDQYTNRHIARVCHALETQYICLNKIILFPHFLLFAYKSTKVISICGDCSSRNLNNENMILGFCHCNVFNAFTYINMILPALTDNMIVVVSVTQVTLECFRI